MTTEYLLQKMVEKINKLEKTVNELARREYTKGGGGGDMLKSVYDTDADNIVDAAETAPWSAITGKPSTFPPDSHTHSASDITSGTLSTDRFSAYNDLVAENKINSIAINALTGDVTASGTGSVSATIANNAITLAKMADMATASLLGRNSTGSGDPEVLNAATVKSMLGFVGGVRLYRTADYELTTSGTLYAIPFTSELQDNASYHNNSTNNTRIIIPSNGWYLINGGLSYAANATGVRDILFRVDGTTYIANQRMQACTDANRGTDLSLTSLYYFTASQYIELMGRQYSGGALNVLANAYNSPVFAAIKLV